VCGNGGGCRDAGGSDTRSGLSWPVDCIPDETCVNLDPPDTVGDGIAYDCGPPGHEGHEGHEGTDIGVSFAQMGNGVSVRAAADGEVFFVSDGKFDHCPNDTEPDCQRPEDYLPGDDTGTNVCTELGPYCGTGTGTCFWVLRGATSS